MIDTLPGTRFDFTIELSVSMRALDGALQVYWLQSGGGVQHKSSKPCGSTNKYNVPRLGVFVKKWSRRGANFV